MLKYDTIIPAALWIMNTCFTANVSIVHYIILSYKINENNLPNFPYDILSLEQYVNCLFEYILHLPNMSSPFVSKWLNAALIISAITIPYKNTCVVSNSEIYLQITYPDTSVCILCLKPLSMSIWSQNVAIYIQLVSRHNKTRWTL